MLGAKRCTPTTGLLQVLLVSLLLYFLQVLLGVFLATAPLGRLAGGKRQARLFQLRRGPLLVDHGVFVADMGSRDYGPQHGEHRADCGKALHSEALRGWEALVCLADVVLHAAHHADASGGVDDLADKVGDTARDVKGWVRARKGAAACGVARGKGEGDRGARGMTGA